MCMSKYNTTITYDTTTITHEGGTAYEKNPYEAWFNFLCSSYLEDKFYEPASSQTKRFIELTQKVYDSFGPEFVARMAVFSRNVLGMRSISQLTAAFLNDKQFEGKRDFYHSFIHRIDDIGEIFSAVQGIYGSNLSHGLIRGCKDALEEASLYKLTKYQMKKKAWNLYDIINVTHAHSTNIDKYKRGDYESPNTWEVKISKNQSQDERELEWLQLLSENSLGYLALIRNIRNICQAANSLAVKAEKDDLVNKVTNVLCGQLINEEAIRKSLVFPYQIYNAYKSYDDMPFNVIQALEKAFRISIQNAPKLSGDSLIIQDVSGSMNSCMSANSNVAMVECGACYAVMMLLQNPNTDIIKFGTHAAMVDKTSLPINTFKKIDALSCNDDLGYGTEVGQAFKVIPKSYDRIFLISDMQCMDYNGVNIYNNYCNRYNSNAHIYSVDLANYRTQFADPLNPRVHLLTSLNDQLLTLIPYIEDGHKLYDAIMEIPKPW